MISVVIPTFNEAGHLSLTLAALVPAAVDGLVREVVISDGGSTDGTLEAADEAGAKIVTSAKGRGQQLAAACAVAKGPWLLILHADSRLAVGWETIALSHIRQQPDRAGYFKFQLDDPSLIARVWEMGVALRCRLLALPYGDQGLLISKALYEAAGGFEAVPLMEDVGLVRRLGRKGLRALEGKILTRSERFRKGGYLGRSLRNWSLLLRYLMGADPAQLVKSYD
jgi:rSAM/selenodomain-associated transferase 2